MKRILPKYLPLTLLAIALIGFGGLAQAKEVRLIPDTDAEAAAIQEEFKENSDYHSLLAVKLARIAVEERGENELSVARQFIKLAEKHAVKARGAK